MVGQETNVNLLQRTNDTFKHFDMRRKRNTTVQTHTQGSTVSVFVISE